MTTALERYEGSASHPDRFLPPGKTQYPLYRRLGGPQVRSGQVRKISPPPGFDPRTVQPVASRYTDWATGPTSLVLRSENSTFYPTEYLYVLCVSQEKKKLKFFLYNTQRLVFITQETSVYCAVNWNLLDLVLKLLIRICNLYNDAAINSDYVVLNDWRKEPHI